MRIAFAAFAIFVSAASAQTWGPPLGAKPAYSLLYTGRLFGYYRYPDVQTSSDRGCPDVATTPLPPQVELFRSTLNELRSGQPELVAMGENFAPELLARAAQNKTPATPHYGELVDKDVLSVGEKEIPSDNVACFLRLMGFDAVVPGQQDFYYGPERLRKIARFLAQPSTGDYKSVQMIASNLVIGSVVRNPNPPVPNGELPAQIRRALDDPAPVHFDLPSTALPWLRHVPISGKAADLAAYDCVASPSDPRNFTLPSAEANRCTKLQRQEGATPGFRVGALEAGSNHALCAEYTQAGESKGHCQLFSVQYPFFESSRPYFVPANENGAVVFGVLDPSLIGYIGQLSDVWMNTDKRFDTGAQITDPLEALRQVLSLCDSDDSCRGRRKVLLAQMPYYKASQLATKLKVFDMVIAQSDEEHATGDETTSRNGSSDTPYVLTPGVAFDARRKNSLSTNLRRVDYYAEGHDKQFMANEVHDTTLPAPPPEPCRTCALNAEVAKSVARPPTDTHLNRTYEELALKAMQRFCGSDIALLQHRDVFSAFGKAVALWPNDFYPSAQQLLDEMLWKGDFTFCLPVSGATLKKVLSESAAFDKQDRDDLSVEVEKGRGLSTLGIETDPNSGLPVIRGQVVEDNKLYGVAMTDYLAFGNTGYPELSSDAIQPVVRVVSLTDLNRLTGLACEQLPADFTLGSCQSDRIRAADYFAAIEQRPFDTSRGLTAWLEFREWVAHPLGPQPNVTTFLAKKTDAPENVVERRGLWWFTLQNVTVGYNLNFIKGSDKTVPGNFVGNNSFSQLSTPESSQFNLWARARGGYSFPRFVDFYMSAEARYSRLAVRNSINNGDFGEYQVTFANNLLRGEAGLTTKPLTGKVPVRLLVSENLLTQAATPFQQFAAPLVCDKLPCSNGATTLVKFNLAKNYLVVTRVGARIQNNQSWFEAGREYGQNIDIPDSYSLQDLATPVPFECPLAKGLLLSNCVAADALFTAQSKIVPRLRTQHVGGWFADFHSAAPLWRSKLQLVADSYGEVFDNLATDTTYNTRFYEDLTLALKVPVWGNLTFAPQIEAFYFQNKVVPDQIAQINHYVFVTTSVTLQYGFDWHRGVGVLRALRYPNGVSTATSATVPRP